MKFEVFILGGQRIDRRERTGEDRGNEEREQNEDRDREKRKRQIGVETTI